MPRGGSSSLSFIHQDDDFLVNERSPLFFTRTTTTAADDGDSSASTSHDVDENSTGSGRVAGRGGLQSLVIVPVVAVLLLCHLCYRATDSNSRSSHLLNIKHALVGWLPRPFIISKTKRKNTIRNVHLEEILGEPSAQDPYIIIIPQDDDLNPDGTPGRHASDADDDDLDDYDGEENAEINYCDRLLLGVWEKSCIMVPPLPQPQQPGQPVPPNSITNNNNNNMPPPYNTNRNPSGGFLRSYPIIFIPHVNGGVDYFGYYSGSHDGNANVANFLELGHAAPSRVETPSSTQHCMAPFSSQFVYYYFPTTTTSSSSEDDQSSNLIINDHDNFQQEQAQPPPPQWVQQDHLTFWNPIAIHQILLANRAGTTCYLQRISASSSSDSNDSGHANDKDDALAKCRETVLRVRAKFHHVSLALEFSPDDVCQTRQ